MIKQGAMYIFLFESSMPVFRSRGRGLAARMRWYDNDCISRSSIIFLLAERGKRRPCSELQVQAVPHKRNLDACVHPLQTHINRQRIIPSLNGTVSEGLGLMREAQAHRVEIDTTKDLPEQQIYADIC